MTEPPASLTTPPAAFPDMKGFSPRNLKYMRTFAEAWPDAEFVQQAVAQLPWYHQLALLDKLPAPQSDLARICNRFVAVLKTHAAKIADLFINGMNSRGLSIQFTL